MSKELAAGTRIGHYEIHSKIGEGGMGEVYLAQDTKLDRKVALKILPGEFAANADRMRRFTQEAKSAAALNHPNIAHIYEIGESDSIHYIAMEFIDGVTLREKIHRDGASLPKLLKYLTQVAEGLTKAHAAGIVHRDLKPDNIMITRDDYAKVLDFGLAKLVEPQKSFGSNQSDSSEIATAMMQQPRGQESIAGMVMGTIGYMSPEQASGRVHDIDHRSDIFSFGCILFGAATGQKAFEGKDALDSLHKIVHAPTPQLKDVNPLAPDDLQRVVRRCLAKEPEKRYQSMKEVAIEIDDLQQDLKSHTGLEYTSQLKSPASAATSGAEQSRSLSPTTITPSLSAPASSAEFIIGEIKNRKGGVAIALLLLLSGAIGLSYWLFGNRATGNKKVESIAVMPFLNESGNADIEYLSDGMTETLINSLSQIPNLSVKARSSVFRYKGKEIDPKKIASTLNVQAILIGRVIQRGDQLTLNLELIDAQTENVLWGNRYERKSSELVALQSEIARDVSNKLKTKLSGADAAKVEKNFTASAEAYQLFLKGRFYAIKRTAKDAKQAIEYYQQAVAIDPTYALAYAGLAEANWFLALYSYPQVNEAIPKARELSLKALALDNSLAEPHSILGVICNTYDRDFACMEREQKRAIELNPNYSESYRRYGLVLENVGRFEEAHVAFKRALEIDPLSPVTNHELAHLLFYERKYEESETQSRKNVELDPNFWYAHLQLFYVYRMKRNYASAVEELAKVQDSRGEPDAAKLIRESFAGGDWPGFLKRITEERARLKLYPYFVATFFAELGEKDKAFAALNEALETKDQHTAWMKVDPYMDPLRDDSRFREVLKKAGFPE